MRKPAESLGSFYLGAEYDYKTQTRTDIPLTYDARDLTTHAVCVGMTGSGKTGLCLGLLEEAALDKVPAILIDPKGDITNLLLQFPELRPEDFRPWINPDDARRKGLTEDDFAKQTAEQWRKGLADWDIDGERIRQLGETAEFTIYTPGSSAGVPISILTSLSAPQLDFDQNAEAIRERIAGTVAALLGLAGVKEDPIRSREGILLSTILESFWRQKKDVDLVALITSIQDPPVTQVGVLDVESFYPKKERFELAMAFNNLMAAPTFQSWLEGEALDVDKLLYTPSGKPRHCVFYIAHLPDNERMFFVTLLLESVLSWVRAQAGTSSLRALLYFDEVFGYFPPTAEPPSKRPLLTLLKQARAFGLGCVLVTQNPADIDYKGLTNAGTWFIGKLQAERDKMRLLEGLQTAAGVSDVEDYGNLIGQLASRVFLVHNVHDKKPVVMTTRWVMCYLRGPLTRPQIQELVGPHETTPAPARKAAEQAAPVPAAAQAAAGTAGAPPSIDPDIPQLYVPVEVSAPQAVRQAQESLGVPAEAAEAQLMYRPVVLGQATVHYVDAKRNVNEEEQKTLAAEVSGQVWKVDWASALALPYGLKDTAGKPASVAQGQGPAFGTLPKGLSDRALKDAGKEFGDWLYYNCRLAMATHSELDITQAPGESQREFKLRLRQAARERRDQEVDALEEKYAARIDKVQEKIRRVEDELAADQADFQARKQQEMVNVGESVVGLFLGRRSTRSLSSYASRRRMTTKAKLEVEKTEREMADLQDDIDKLEAEMKEAADEITAKWAESLDEGLTETSVKPRRSDVDVNVVGLGWLPTWVVREKGEGTTKSVSIAAYKTVEPETD